jgi:hypothetical protein
MSSSSTARVLGMIFSWGLLLSAAAVSAAEFRVSMERSYQEARTAWQRNTTNVEAIVRFGREAFDWAEIVTAGNQRAEIASEAVDALRLLKDRQPSLAEVRYFLAMNLGQLARTRTLGALKLVREMEQEFKAAIAIDPAVDFSGPDRNLGKLYHFAPGWPTSLGNDKKARLHLEAAVKRDPDYPGNRLAMVEFLLDRREVAAAKKELATLDEGWARAQKQWTGPAWEDEWQNWTEQRNKHRKQLAGLTAPPVSPKNVR